MIFSNISRKTRLRGGAWFVNLVREPPNQDPSPLGSDVCARNIPFWNAEPIDELNTGLRQKTCYNIGMIAFLIFSHAIAIAEQLHDSETSDRAAAFYKCNHADVLQNQLDPKSYATEKENSRKNIMELARDLSPSATHVRAACYEAKIKKLDEGQWAPDGLVQEACIVDGLENLSQNRGKRNSAPALTTETEKARFNAQVEKMELQPPPANATVTVFLQKEVTISNPDKIAELKNAVGIQYVQEEKKVQQRRQDCVEAAQIFKLNLPSYTGHPETVPVTHAGK